MGLISGTSAACLVPHLHADDLLVEVHGAVEDELHGSLVVALGAAGGLVDAPAVQAHHRLGACTGGGAHTHTQNGKMMRVELASPLV